MLVFFRRDSSSGLLPAALPAASLAVLLAALAGCGSLASTRSADRRSASPHATTPTQRVVAHLMINRPFRTIKPGTVVSPSGVGARVFADADHGFGLYDSPGGEQQPAATVDGGRTWRIDGPVFHAPAADGAEGVSYTGTARRSTYFAYGSSAVDVTTDAGRHWWQALLGEVVLAVVAKPEELVAVVQQTTNGKTRTWVYVSTDGGRVWRYDDRLDAYTSVPQVIDQAPRGVPACSAAQVHIRSPAAVDGLLGTEVVPVWLDNRSRRACLLGGYPIVTILGPRRRPLSVVIRHGELGPREPRAETPVVLPARGGRAMFGLSFTDHPGPAPAHDCGTFRFIRIELPGQRTARTIVTGIVATACGGRPGPWLYLSPIGS